MRSVFFLSLILGCINVASAYQCYSCSNTEKGSCGDPFDANSMTDADKIDVPPGGACVKTKLETKGGTQITRLPTSDTTVCFGGINGCKQESQSGATAYVCCCTSDLCNGVSIVRQQSLTIVFIAMGTFAMFIYRWF